MDAQLLLQIIVGLLAVLMSIIGYCVTQHRSEHNKLKDDHTAHKMTVSEYYAKKADLNSARDELRASIRHLHEKIESVDENLGKNISEIPEKVIRLLDRTNRSS